MDNEALEASPLAVRLRAVFGRQLEAWAVSLRAKFPTVRVRSYHHAAGSSTGFLAYSVELECSFADDVPGWSDNVCLDVTVCHLDSTPLINAGIAWGSSEHAPPGDQAAREKMESITPDDFFAGWRTNDEWPPASPETLARLEADLPRLLSGLEAVVAFAVELMRSRGATS